MVVTQVGHHRLLRSSCWTALAWITGALAAARPAGAESIDASIGLLSDKVSRGYSKSQGRATVEGDVAYRLDSGFFVGLGATDLRAGSPVGRVELVATAGRGLPLDADWSLQASASRYKHVGGTRYINTDYTDLTLSLDWRGRGGLLVTASPDTRTGPRRGWTALAELSWSQPLSERWSIDAGAGRIDNSGIDKPGYGYGSAGIAYRDGGLHVFATRVFSQAVSRGAYSATSQASRWVVALVYAR